MPRPDDPNQTSFSFAAAVVIPQGDGSFVVKPGRPVQWLSVAQVAPLLSCSKSSVYRYVDMGEIPEDCVQYIGPRKMRIRADAVDRAVATWSARRKNR